MYIFGIGFFQNNFILKNEIIYQRNAPYDATSKLFTFAKYRTFFLYICIKYKVNYYK